MASAPKKLRVGEERPVDQEMPLNEEQPRADEMPPAEGIPLVNHGPARPPHRLPAKGRSYFHYHMGTQQTPMNRANNTWPPGLPVGLPLVRVLLVNRCYLDAFFDHQHFGAAKILVESGGWIHFAKFGPWPRRRFKFVSRRDGVGVVDLLRLSRNLTTLDVEWEVESGYAYFRMLLEWMHVASALHALPELVSIKLNTSDCNYEGVYKDEYPFLDMFVDSLPDCVTHVKADNFRFATLLRKRKTPLEVFEVSGDDGEHPYLADVFRLNTRCIELDLRPFGEGEIPQAPVDECGPFVRNENLKELQIDGQPLAKTAISQLLRHLRPINDHFKLICVDNRYIYSEESEEMWKDLNEFVLEAKKLAVDMREAGFNTENAELRIWLDDSWSWPGVSREEVTAYVGWKPEGKAEWFRWKSRVETCSLVHDNVRIVMGLDPWP